MKCYVICACWWCCLHGEKETHYSMCYFKDPKRQNCREKYSVELLMLKISYTDVILIVSEGSYLSALLNRTNFSYNQP